MLIRFVQPIALLTTGLLAGAFGYGAANLAPTFHRVPLQMRLEFHTELMKNNSISMQITMAAAALSCFGLAASLRGRLRALAVGAGVLVVGSFLITRLGNVPINHQINRWALEGAPADHLSILTRWDNFHYLRTGTALFAFVVIIALTVRPGLQSTGRYDTAVSKTVSQSAPTAR